MWWKYELTLATKFGGHAQMVTKFGGQILVTKFGFAGWETSAHPLANASENLVGRVENRNGRVEFCIGYIRDYPVQASAKIFFSFPARFVPDR